MAWPPGMATGARRRLSVKMTREETEALEKEQRAQPRRGRGEGRAGGEGKTQTRTGHTGNAGDKGKHGDLSCSVSAKSSNAPEHVWGMTQPRSRLKLSHNWLLWLGIGTAATANSLGASSTASLCVGALFLIAWGAFDLTAVRLLRAGSNFIIELYFREYMAIGAEKVPDTGPVVFVCGPHSNQFLDPMVVSKGVRREIRYISAAKSLRRKDVGWLFKFTRPIPVERSQDLAKKGRGKIRMDGSRRVIGTGTDFRAQIQNGGKDSNDSRLGHIRVRGFCVPMAVEKVISSTELVLKKDPPQGDDAPTGQAAAQEHCYEILPSVCHDEMFNQVYDHLGLGDGGSGGALGIFPEGGSHDQTKLLPLKVGVCLMALGAMDKYRDSNCQVTLVPVGLNYFSQHKFNSRVLVKYGDPIFIKPALVEQFSTGGSARKQAVQSLLDVINQALREVTVQAPDWDTMRTFWALRDLYCPAKRLMNMSMVDKVILSQAFANDYPRVKGDKGVDELLPKISKYARKLNTLGIKDRNNLETVLLVQSRSRAWLLCLLVVRCFYILIIEIIWFPVHLLLMMPIYIIAILYSRRMTKQACEASKVKITGNDVMGTYKLIVALPMLVGYHLWCCSLIWYRFGEGASVAWFFYAPFIEFIAYKSVPSDLELIRSAHSLALAIFRHQDLSQLFSEREALKRQARQVVDRLQWGHAVPEVQQEILNRGDSLRVFMKDPFYRDLNKFGDQFSHLMASFMDEDIHHDLFLNQ